MSHQHPNLITGKVNNGLPGDAGRRVKIPFYNGCTRVKTYTEKKQ